MGLNWMDVTDLSFNTMLLLEREQLQWLTVCRVPKRELIVALQGNPVVEWFLRHKCPEIVSWLDKLCSEQQSYISVGPEELRRCEVAVLEAINDWVVFAVDPSCYDRQPFLKWDSNELLSLVDFSNKTVLDVGAGTGRLTLLATKEAKSVYAVEPVANLRRYLRTKAESLGVSNLYVVDGLLQSIPFPAGFFDVSMGGHVFGDWPAAEYAELLRVTKPGGMIILCPGNGDRDNGAHLFLVDNGFEWSRFEEPRDGMMRKYWKRV